MYILVIDHIDQPNAGGQTQENELATFEKEEWARLAVDHLTKTFPQKHFYYYNYEEPMLLFNPYLSELEELVKKSLK